VTDEARILDLEATGYAAIQAGEANLLRQILAPDFLATTVDGKTLHRDEWIALVTTAATHGISLQPHPATLTVGVDIATVHREVTIATAAGAAPHPRRVSYVTVYERRDGRWRVVLNSSRPA
jgi:uncharacterized protein (TIGR02246 family)